MKKILSSFIFIICSLLLSSCSFHEKYNKIKKELELRGYNDKLSYTDFDSNGNYLK